MRKWWPVFLLAALVFGLDQLTKWTVSHTLDLHEFWLKNSPVRITHVRNTGSAFGFFPEQTVFLIIASFVAILVMVLYYRRVGKPNPLVTVSFGLQLGGAVGNLFDRIRQGYVVDFIDFRVWPVFNAADSAITIGLVILVSFFLLEGRAEKQRHLPPPSTPQAEPSPAPTGEQPTVGPEP
ncbi:MAG: signal peptidase II [Chloroflexi bacterium]|nr:signal peptidase II [Chloroflexota bacterium]